MACHINRDVDDHRRGTETKTGAMIPTPWFGSYLLGTGSSVVETSATEEALDLAV